MVVDGGCPALFSVVEKNFRKTAEFAYGSTPNVLSSIREGKEFICEMLVQKDTPKAFMIYRRTLDPHSGLDLKQFTLLDQGDNSSVALDVQMLEHLKAIAYARFAQNISTVTNSDKEAEFFQRHGFKLEHQKTTRGAALTTTGYRLRMDLERIDEASTQPPEKRRRIEERTAEFYRGEANSRSSVGAMDDYSDFPSIERCPLRREYVEQIRSGEKTYEGRVRTAAFRSYKAGMSVCWFAGPVEVLTRIVSINHFYNFEQMIRTIGYKKLLPRVRSEMEAINAYYQIPGYAEKVQRSGAVAFELEVIQPGMQDKSSKKRSWAE